MNVYCLLCLEYFSGLISISSPKILGIYKSKEEAYKQKNIFSDKYQDISIQEILLE
mgnify:CR=1 FL=1|uniref:Uncharacterized protein n=1 Tax=viral metagenome TaxID=1070528 RepID=A0A6C0EJZ5_9ZZZZ